MGIPEPGNTVTGVPRVGAAVAPQNRTLQCPRDVARLQAGCGNCWSGVSEGYSSGERFYFLVLWLSSMS